jgi:hypothetical protein
MSSLFEIFVCLLFGIMVGFVIGIDMTQGKAIEHECAIYHPKTGEFTWNKKEIGSE